MTWPVKIRWNGDENEPLPQYPLLAREPFSACVMTMTKPYTVLIADDSKQIRLTLERFIVTLGHTVIVATDGQEAVDLFVAHAPDLIILDVMMPGIDGYETTRQIRKQAEMS